MERLTSTAEEGGAFDWWGEIDESERWQSIIFRTLCAVYAVVSCIALVQLCRIQQRVPDYGWTTQKALEMALLDIPSLLFFSTYTLLVLFWAEIYYQARSLPIGKLRLVYLATNGLIYLAQVGIWIYVRVSSSPIAVEVAKLFFAVISFLAALGFLIFDGRLFVMLSRFPIESKGRQKKLNEVGTVTGICCSCFIIRCFMVALSVFDKDAELDVLDHPILNFLYYLLVEILPSVLVLFILRKLPPKRVSDKYHPIR